MAEIDYSTLTCVSLTAASSGLKSAATVYVGDAAVPVIRVPGVLFDPGYRVQVVGAGLVPLESVQTRWNFDFRIGSQQGPRDVGDIRDSEDEVCILSNGWSYNFGHWITEELAKVVVLERAGFTGKYVVATGDNYPVHVRPAFVLESLRLMGIGDERILGDVSTATRFRAAYYVPPFHLDSIREHEEVFHLLADTLIALATDDGSGTLRPRVWMQRGVTSLNGRSQIVNAEEVGDVLARFDVTPVDMAALPLARQLGVARSARLLCAPHGSAMVHALFMPRSSVAIECYNPNFINPTWTQLMRLKRHRYHMTVPASAYDRYPWQDALWVDCEQLELVLETLP